MLLNGHMYVDKEKIMAVYTYQDLTSHLNKNQAYIPVHFGALYPSLLTLALNYNEEIFFFSFCASNFIYFLFISDIMAGHNLLHSSSMNRSERTWGRSQLDQGQAWRQETGM